MENKLRWFALLMLIHPPVFAGDKEGNGGGVIVCDDGRIEPYDLYEGRRFHQIPENPIQGATYLDIVKIAMKNIQTKLGTTSSRIQYSLNYMLEQGNTLILDNIEWDAHLLKEEASIDASLHGTQAGDVPSDAHILFVEKNCHYKKIAYWDHRTGKLLIKQEYFNQLSEFQKATIYLHEPTYHMAYRFRGDLFSDDSRLFVAQVMNQADSFYNFFPGRNLEPGIHFELRNILDGFRILRLTVNYENPDCWGFSKPSFPWLEVHNYSKRKSMNYFGPGFEGIYHDPHGSIGPGEDELFLAEISNRTFLAMNDYLDSTKFKIGFKAINLYCIETERPEVIIDAAEIMGTLKYSDSEYLKGVYFEGE